MKGLAGRLSILTKGYLPGDYMRSYSNYNSSMTIKYKSGFIHVAYLGNTEVVRVSIDNWAYATEVKSVLAAKQAISRHTNRSNKGKS